MTVTDLLWWLSALFVLTGLASRSPPGRFSFRLFILDSLPIVLFALVVARIGGDQTIRASFGSQLSSGLYIGLYLLIALVSLQMMALDGLRRWPPPNMWILGPGFCLAASGAIAWSILGSERLTPAHWASLLWLCGLLLVGVAGFRRGFAPDSFARLLQPERDRGVRALPPAGAIVGLLLLQLNVVGAWERVFLLALTIAAVLLVAARFYLVRSQLLRSQEALSLREELLRETERRYRTLVEQLPLVIYLERLDQESAMYMSPQISTLIGYTAEEWVSDPGFFGNVLHPDDRDRVLDGFAWMHATGAPIECEYRLITKGGAVIWIHDAAVVVHDDTGRPLYAQGYMIDISARRQAEAEQRLSEERYRALVEKANDVIFTADLDGAITSINPAGEQLTGLARDDLLAGNIFGLLVPEDVERARDVLARRRSSGDDEIIELELVGKDSRRVRIEVSGSLIEEEGRPVGIQGIARDTTERHALQAELAHQAFHDPLTGLPNRALFHDRLGQALTRAERAGSRVAVMLLDLDNFKLVNDSLGHEIGDEVLIAIASRLSEVMRAGDTVVRLGGDEFAVVVESFRDERELVALAERIMSVFDKTVVVGSRLQPVTASLGIALGKRGDTPDVLLRSADTAMYRAKETRRGSFELFDDAMRSRVLRELEVRNALADALRHQDLHVYYQPIVSLTTGEVLSIEALVRWLHPQWGWVAPSEFIPLAETDGLIIALGQYVLTETARQAALWRDRYPEALPLGVFVNASPRELAQSNFVASYTHTLHEHGLTPRQLGLELTERVFINKRDVVVTQNIAELARIGARLSLDDFGTGYSALASLNRFPFTTLKIDRTFIHSIRTTADTAPISTAIVTVGKALGLTVVAEGVETQVQADYLRQLGCDAAQGFHYLRPQPASEVTAYLDAKLNQTGPSTYERRQSVA